jgi:filamentous hemagglutinin family protein
LIISGIVMATGSSKLFTAASAVVIFGLIGGASAEVATDGTVGPRMRLGGPEFDIRADLGTRAGRNLFHSFERFSLASGERATFSGPDEIRNVLSRVTGDELSYIDGTIASTIPGADFFFINPAGVTFGPNATLDVQGSFHVSTADELRFSDGAVFSATNPSASSLTVAAPEAFGFLGAAPAAITVDRSTLAVDEGQAFSIVGGSLSLSAGVIAAPGGAINLVSAAPSTAVRVADGEPASRDGGEIEIVRSLVFTLGDGGGTIRVRGGNFVVDQSQIEASNLGDRPSNGSIDVRLVGDLTLSQSRIRAGTVGSGSGGTVNIDAANITLSDGLLNSNSLLGAGNAGSVTVVADRLTLLEGSQISSSTGQESTGAGGEVQVTARESLLIAGRNARDDPSGIFASTEGAANSDRAAGNVTVTAGDLKIRDDGEIGSSTRTAGAAGTVTVMAGTLELRAGSITGASLAAGAAGSVTVTADRLTLLGGSQISSSPLLGSTGAGGEVQVTAREALLIAGRDARNTPSGIFASAEGAANSVGAAGDVTVTVTAGDLEIRDGGEISSAALRGGDAGKVTVEADRLVLDRAEVTTSSASAGGGEIQLRVRDLIDLRDSAITTSVAGGNDPTAGNIRIDPKVLVIDGSTIKADSDTGSGGNVQIVAANILVAGGDLEGLIARGDISASGETEAMAGAIAISAPEVDLAGGLVVLEGALLDAASQLRERCAARRDIDASSFTGVGRGGLPPSPDGPLSSAYVIDKAAIAEAQGTAPADVRLAGLSAPCAPRD